VVAVAPKDIAEFKVSKDHLVLDRKVFKVEQVAMAYQDQKEHKALQVQLDRKVFKV
jgi:hypothetical protein